MKKIDPVLHDKLEQLVSSMGCELVGCEQVSMGGRSILRIYIDRENGVTVEDCSRVSRQVGAMMDVEQPRQSGYTLEVSSPGIDRPLFLLKHYAKFVGSQVKIKLHVPIDKRRQLKGLLTRVEGENIHILIEGLETEIVLPFSAIEKGNLNSAAR